MSPISSTSSNSAAGSSTAVTAASAKTDQNMFLQLLVEQMKNQDPTQPMDSTTFVTQLAQFQQLEATTNMQTSLTGIQSNTNTLVSDFGSSNGSTTQS